MPMHSVLVVTAAGNVIFSKYFDPRVSSGSKYLIFEQDIFNHTSFLWHKVGRQIVMINDVYVVYQRFSDFIIFASGTLEVDEIILSEVIDCLERILDDSEAKSEKQFLEPEKYGKWIIALDEMMLQGFLENTDADRVLKMSKLKNL